MNQIMKLEIISEVTLKKNEIILHIQLDFCDEIYNAVH